MSPKIRVTLLVTLLIGVLVVTAGLFFGIMPQRENAAAAESQRETAEAHNALLQSQLEQLAEDSEALTERREQFARQLQAFPEENQYARYIDDLDLIADEQSVEYRVMETGEKVVFDLGVSPWQGEGSGEFGDLTDSEGTGPDGAETPSPADQADAGDEGDPQDGAGLGVGDPFSGRELVAVPVVIEVSGGATGIRHFVRLVQTGDRYTTLTSLRFEAYGDDDEDAPPIGVDDDSDQDGAEPASFSVTPLPLSLPMTPQTEPPASEDPDAEADPSDDEGSAPEDEEDGGSESEPGSPASLGSGPDVLFGETVARMEGYIWILREAGGGVGSGQGDEPQLDSTAPADEDDGTAPGTDDTFDVEL